MDSFPERKFSNSIELQQCLAEMDIVIEEPATVGGLDSLYYKGLRYKTSRHEASIVGKTYVVLLHPVFLNELREGLDAESIQPQGSITETFRGVLTADLKFFNPAFDIAKAVGAIDSDTKCYVGITARNTYGAPTSCLNLDAIAVADDGTKYVFGDILGARRVRHVGKLKKNLKSLIKEVVKALPDLGQHIEDAKQTPMERIQVDWTLRALGYGPKGREAILNHNVSSAWSLYDRLCRFARRDEVGSDTRMGELIEAQAVLDANRLHRLLETGRQLELDEKAALEREEAARKDHRLEAFA